MVETKSICAICVFKNEVPYDSQLTKSEIKYKRNYMVWLPSSSSLLFPYVSSMEFIGALANEDATKIPKIICLIISGMININKIR